MIIIKSTEGNILVNENEVKAVRHVKCNASAVILFNNGHKDIEFKVESVYYTNKQDVEINDYGLMLGAVESDKTYYQELSKCYEAMTKELVDRRNELERFIIEWASTPDECIDYRKHFIQKLIEERKNRPTSFEDEMRERRGDSWYFKIRDEGHLNGKKLKAEFERMTKDIEFNHEKLDLYLDKLRKLMNRSLWQRIINKDFPL